ncbi:response regulator transcription factor [Falsiroseomonas sp. CW058]|uniref:response regulator transcription factor n=1 Tax=Falsiroseomonas sp. CW058 TaxID=3388664 RepID=UPI003D32003C
MLVHLRAGRSNKGIARLLGLRESTVKAQVRQIMKKLGAANRTQAVLVGLGQEVEPANDRAPAPVQLLRCVI